MTFRILDRAQMSVTGAPGTGNITLGTNTTGYQTFAQAGLTDQDTFSYVVVDGTSWEYGVGTYTLATYSGGSGAFSATPVIDSGSLVAGTAGTVVTSGGLVTLQVDNSQPNPTNITYTVSGSTMTLNWPVGQGWQLQSNSVSLSNPGTWQTVTGATPPYPVINNPSQPAVFYRLKY